MIEALGILGGVCFAYCGVPVAWATLKAGRHLGTPVAVAWMIVIGAILMYAYLYARHGFDPILTLNYSVEAASWAVVIWFRYFGSR